MVKLNIYIIRPQEQSSHHPLFYAFSSSLNDQLTTKETIYLVAVDTEYGFLGNARLLPSHSASVDKTAIHQLGLKIHQRVWECNKISFHAKSLKRWSLRTEDINDLKIKFYKELYDALTQFAKANDIDAYITIATHEEQQEIFDFGNWPFLTYTSAYSATDGGIKAQVSMLPIF